LAYGVVALVAAARVGRLRHREPDGFAPPVTVLKPVKGLDPDQLENFRSIFRQDYPSYQILFGVADLEDPAVPAIHQVLAEHPDADAHLVVCPDLPGPNAKVSKLHRMVTEARHEILVVSDSDTRVEPDYLRRVAAALADPGVGVVTALYRGGAPVGLGAHLERLSIHALFVPGALVACLLEGRLTFGLGATLAVRRKVLDELGGFAAFTHVLAEDYLLANRAVAGGASVALADTVAECVLGRIPFREFFLHQLRWARTNRCCRPLGYLGAFVRHGIALSLILLLLAGPTPLALALLAATAALQAAVAWTVSARVLCAPDPARGLWLLPLADLLGLFLWILAYAGNTVTWRGQRYRMTRRGELVPLGGS
jgi:ceramide glucosyltransferase